MYNFLRQVSRNQHFQDAAGVVRGLAKVNTQILLRSNHASSDLQRFSKNVSRDLEVLGQKFEEASEFVNTANETFSIPDNLGEFVTFKKPEFDFEEEKKLYDQSQRQEILGDQKKLNQKGGVKEENRAATFQNIDNFSQDDLEKIQEEAILSEEELMQVTDIDLGKTILQNIPELTLVYR